MDCVLYQTIKNMRRLLVLLAKVLAGYALVGFAVVPAALHFAASQAAPKFLSVPMQLGAVLFNPFTLRLSLQSIKLGESKEHVAGFSEFSIDLAWDSVINRELHIQSIKLKKPFADVVLQNNDKINLSSVVKASKKKSSSDSDNETASEGTSTLQVHLDQLSVQQASFSFLDQLIALESGTPFAAKISKLDIYGTDLGWPNMDGEINVSGRINGDSTFSLNNKLALPAMELAAKASLQNIDLTLIQPYLTPFVFVELENGKLTTKLDLTWTEQNGAALSSDLNISQLNVKDERDQSSIIVLRKLDLSGIQYSQAKNTLAIKEISLIEPVLRVAIESNLQINLAGLLKQKKETLTREKTAQVQSTETEPLTFDIGKISIQKGSMDFADRSFSPGFVTPINNLNGEISKISSASSSPTTLAITGQIDRYSPVTINGQVDISAPLENSEFKLAFDSVELTTLTPYAGRFAGYTIHKGRMDLELFYRLQNSELFAQNSMLLEHLTLGEKVDSDEAVDLPIRLAIALLKDRDGRIDIKLPVKGNLNNPEFELGPLIRMALINMLTNIVSAPFDFLASLVGGDASEMQAVGFSQGVDSIAPHQKKALDSLVSALRDRPEMQLEVMGTATVKEDWPLVAEALLEQVWINELSALKKQTDTPSLPEKETLELLKSIAQKQQIDIPEALKYQEAREFMVESWPYDEGALRSLAIRRAKGIKDYLTEQGLEAERVFILDVQTPKENLTEESAIISKLELTSE